MTDRTRRTAARTQTAPRGKKMLGRAAFAAALLCAGSAAAQSCLVEQGMTIQQNGFIQAYAITAPGPIIFVNENYGARLGRETQAWLLERQCYLAANYAAQATPGVDGELEFSAGQHAEADCVAYRRVVEAESGRATVVRVIDRDVSRQQRGDYWDIGMGRDLRPIASADCR